MDLQPPFYDKLSYGLDWIFYLGKTLTLPGRKDRDVLKCFTCLDVNKNRKGRALDGIS